MSKFCSITCNAICDFCKFYKDYGTESFDGSGTCVKKEIEVDASDYCEDDFECFRCLD